MSELFKSVTSRLTCIVDFNKIISACYILKSRIEGFIYKRTISSVYNKLMDINIIQQLFFYVCATT